MVGQPSYPGAPRWLKVSAIAIGGVALLLVVLVHGGRGLQHHMPSISSLSHNAAPEGGR
jgi:ABC-type phosphate transport system auxiliary subunit